MLFWFYFGSKASFPIYLSFILSFVIFFFFLVSIYLVFNFEVLFEIYKIIIIF